MKIWDLPTTEKDAIEFLQNRGLPHNSRKCRKGHEMKLYHKYPQYIFCGQLSAKYISAKSR